MHSLKKLNAIIALKTPSFKNFKNLRIEKLRLNPELTSLVCNMIKICLTNSSKHHKTDKNTKATKILTAPFWFKSTSDTILKDQIDVLINNNNIVKFSKAIEFIKILLSKAGIKLQNIILL